MVNCSKCLDPDCPPLVRCVENKSLVPVCNPDQMYTQYSMCIPKWKGLTEGSVFTITLNGPSYLIPCVITVTIGADGLWPWNLFLANVCLKTFDVFWDGCSNCFGLIAQRRWTKTTWTITGETLLGAVIPNSQLPCVKIMRTCVPACKTCIT